VDHFEGEIPCAVEEFYGEQVNRQGVVPERGDDQQLSDQHPAEDEDEEHRGNNLSRTPSRTNWRIDPNLPTPLLAIGQTPIRESDKRRLAFRTEADTEGWRAGLFCT
jgi:hypothetical protein